MPKFIDFGEFWKPESFVQTVLPDRSVLEGQKLIKCQNWNDAFFHVMVVKIPQQNETFERFSNTVYWR